VVWNLRATRGIGREGVTSVVSRADGKRATSPDRDMLVHSEGIRERTISRQDVTNRPSKIFVAEADERTRIKLLELLSERGYDVTIATGAEDSWRVLQDEEAPSLVIIDREMAGAMQLCRLVRQWHKERYVYILIRSAQSGTAEMVACMQAGADDFIEKRCAFEELHARLRAGERILRLQEQLRIEASHDALTGTLNRRAIRNALEREAARSVRQSSPLGVLLLDIDHFKKVNDTFGHTFGDAVLKLVSRRLSVPLRRYDAVGRYGGEEFLVVLPQCDLEQTAEIGERVRLSVASAPLETSAGDIAVTVSIGAATMNNDPAFIDELIQRADRALYEAKRQGRNRVMPHVSTLEHEGIT
jgi:two-component system cell cycle response regulator